ncbi:MAG TPA: anaerobic ribonucleoside-triphosphate reductase activating protein, partial [Ruminococcus sp.]|nr:anaerobic ribonucleoside-triphosphate reductase activating protein [Ruminococcus sp.]
MRFHDISRDNMLNGDGLRAVLWVAGCSHQCKDCHNPITWDINGGVPFDEAAEKELFEALSPSYISGITFSGGDPLHIKNRDEVGRLIEKI